MLEIISANSRGGLFFEIKLVLVLRFYGITTYLIKHRLWFAVQQPLILDKPIILYVRLSLLFHFNLIYKKMSDFRLVLLKMLLNKDTDEMLQDTL